MKIQLIYPDHDAAEATLLPRVTITPDTGCGPVHVDMPLLQSIRKAYGLTWFTFENSVQLTVPDALVEVLRPAPSAGERR